jgi:hypothetical protein
MKIMSDTGASAFLEAKGFDNTQMIRQKQGHGEVQLWALLEDYAASKITEPGIDAEELLEKVKQIMIDMGHPGLAKHTIIAKVVSEAFNSLSQPQSNKCISDFGDYKCHVTANIKDGEYRPVQVDKALKELVELLNSNGFKTVASCCGHGKIQPVVSIEMDFKTK